MARVIALLWLASRPLLHSSSGSSTHIGLISFVSRTIPASGQGTNSARKMALSGVLPCPSGLNSQYQRLSRLRCHKPPSQ
ncbi:hypothetical protein BJX68DRAFT_150293 [Aspergillus pseudodeflectus]|uniref:Secreted protein n=1 Tax=Aspergillus pseudodeflectus TaxID=176178 RepID=A0ABR4JW51_9EURO